MATYTYKPNKRLIAVLKKDGKVSVLDIGKFDKDGKMSTTAAAKVALLDKAKGVSKGKGATGGGV